MSYKLKDDGFPYLKIYSGKQWVGRVYKNAQGLWVCQIGKQTYHTGRTAEEAFHEGTARHMGYSSLAALRDSNRRIQERNASKRSSIRELTKGFLHQPVRTQLAILEKIEQIADAPFPKPNRGEV